MAVRQALSVLLLVLSIGCGGSPTQPVLLPIGEPFELRMGAMATLNGDIRVLFRDVHSDSRCPIDAVCVRAGEAVVEIALAQRPDPLRYPTATQSSSVNLRHILALERRCNLETTSRRLSFRLDEVGWLAP